MSSSEISSWSRHGFEINTDKSRLDRESILKMLGATYWARDVSPERLWTSILNSRAYGLYSPDGEQAGFGRMVTDYTRFAWMSDVYILPVHRGNALGKWIVETMVNDPALAPVSRIMLSTNDAHSLYHRFGFTVIGGEGEEGRQTMQLKR
ncbi:GNAT family N-acetyltransferase [Parvibaculum sp.]|jgi:GNAT superfamily N-acetyltransferase|uniref:GNAT family N-acetyltransferase n=1 Tax=Parvibaculum sp. TaxID=2024848 RepID=UPI000C4B6F0D|nr:GNAT family N-acetyltransferase [Parvibaculum sp.]HAC58734.1 GNAT family N-acetyltransferase [Rhodobiaceae bacterium]MAU61986.1 GNAT family N-acetyltransferase [Parvibaculum sp.]MBO6666878.1 GNAT family N-acetyltransferase [Parvibaculum sp.]MBO6691917.1 GNAT family N-acetyltransferase [Parvibaculum sp.]MBO6713499.1 GNAT family N-acetyltransferase [Parvibaculum sp.]|tara:strand:+ start:3231 stop:3680 length:450 start_codon:yes stop_codon:yes gene_type:complete